jgi:3-mercaptopyruvate sulfurtransferase SseA
MTLPLLLEPEELNAHLKDDRLLIVDLGKESVYLQAHVPGAILVNGKQLVLGELPAPGRLPPVERLVDAFSAMGLTPDTHVVVYDDEGGGWAGRFIWTLDAIGHRHYSYLNGGIHAWLAASLPIESTPNPATRTSAVVNLQQAPVADIDYVLAHFRDADHVIWDARSAEEFCRHSYASPTGRPHSRRPPLRMDASHGSRQCVARSPAGRHSCRAGRTRHHRRQNRDYPLPNPPPFRIYLSGRQVTGLCTSEGLCRLVE